MEIQPLTKKIYNEAISKSIVKIILSFRGGSDEGYLDIGIYDIAGKYLNGKNRSFCEEISSWAWSVYNYSGAGEGNEYGDEITYDLLRKQMSHKEWYTHSEIIEQDPSIYDIEISS